MILIKNILVKKGGSNMSITISRNTGYAGWYLRIQIIINGEKINTINDNKSVEIELPIEKSYLKVRQFLVKSNEIVVKDGDIVNIKTTWWYRMIIPVMIILQILTVFIIFLDNILITLLFLVVFIIIIILFIINIIFNNGFHIKIINSITQ